MYMICSDNYLDLHIKLKLLILIYKYTYDKVIAEY
jgi:hypothetical protein